MKKAGQDNGTHPPEGKTHSTTLAVVIVNYNVQYFLEQCLHSVRKATRHIDARVYVVDNHSVDGSVEMVREKFPEVHLIANQDNPGFAKANNQAIRIDNSKYVLLLNPDTLVEEDTFSKIVGFMDKNPQAGALGVKMIDGKGRFLPESKRGLPTPRVSFYKIFGLSAMFPKSRKFGKYHLGYLDEDETHEVDVLAGAFMLLRREALDKAGLLDETFFMYGEDIDLSYRIQQAGYKNYYYPETRIIHYKGESTKKGSINYVRVFYNAMIIFARKHFSMRHTRLFIFIIRMAVYFRALLSLVKRFFQRITLPVWDMAVIYLGYFFLLPFWENYQFQREDYYPPEYLKIAVPVYVIIWFLGIWGNGGYRKPVMLKKILKGIFTATVVILVIYSLLPEGYRYSRALILLGAGWAAASTLITRLLLHLAGPGAFRLARMRKKRVIIAGSQAESQRVSELLRHTGVRFELLGRVPARPGTDGKPPHILGQWADLPEIARMYKADELIFCSTDIRSEDIIAQMLGMSPQEIEFKIAPPSSFSVIGSNSIHTSGELYVVDFNSIGKPENKRQKRLLDLSLATFLLLLAPLTVWFLPNKTRYLHHLWQILTGSHSFVGYWPQQQQNGMLPALKPGFIYPRAHTATTAPQRHEQNLFYAKNYKIRTDIKLIIKYLKELG